MTTITKENNSISQLPVVTPIKGDTTQIADSQVSTVAQGTISSSGSSMSSSSSGSSMTSSIVPSASTSTDTIISGSSVPSAQLSSLKDLPISKLFATQAPTDVLRTICGKECHCIPQFSRPKETRSDARQMTEEALSDLIAAKLPKSETVTICSIASGNCTEELFLLTKLVGKGYDKVKFILVDPYYFDSRGTSALKSFTKYAKEICPKVKIETLGSLEEISKSDVQADVFFDFDDGQLDESTDDYYSMMQSFEKYMHSLDKPVIYLHSEKRYAGSSKGMINVKAVINLNYISPTEKDCESRTIFDKTMPMKENPLHHIKLLGEEEV
jgi:hypothetical protein